MNKSKDNQQPDPAVMPGQTVGDTVSPVPHPVSDGEWLDPSYPDIGYFSGDETDPERVKALAELRARQKGRFDEAKPTA